MIYEFHSSDLDEIKLIHKQYFASEFTFEDFISNYTVMFSTRDKEGKLIAVGGVRPLMEMVAITDMSANVFRRKKSYFELLQACSYVAKQMGHKQLHAFVQGDRWAEACSRLAFRQTAGKALVLDI